MPLTVTPSAHTHPHPAPARARCRGAAQLSKQDQPSLLDRVKSVSHLLRAHTFPHLSSLSLTQLITAKPPPCESHSKTHSIHSKYLFRLQIHHQTTSHSISTTHAFSATLATRRPALNSCIHLFSLVVSARETLFLALHRDQNRRAPASTTLSRLAHHHQNIPSQLHTSKPPSVPTNALRLLQPLNTPLSSVAHLSSKYVSCPSRATCTFQLHFLSHGRLQLRLRHPHLNRAPGDAVQGSRASFYQVTLSF